MLRLKAERLRRGWSQTHVTTLTGISGSDVSAIERGVRYAPPGWRRRLAVAFRLTEAELFAAVADSTEAREAGVERPTGDGAARRR